MTYTRKLACRLAMLRTSAMFIALPVAAACSNGGPTGIGDAGSTPNLAIVLAPQRVTLEAKQQALFQAHAGAAVGDSLLTAVEWTATGGTIRTDGLYSSDAAGSFRVIGRKVGQEPAADTAVVTVVPQQTSLTGLSVSPSSASVAAGGQQTFTAVGRLPSGSTAAVGVNWAATGGTIDAGGTYTAGATAGTYQVIAKAASSNVADTIAVAVTALSAPPPAPAPAPTSGGSAGYANQPSGYARVAEDAFTTNPPSSGGCTEAGVLAGCWWQWTRLASIKQDGGAPQSGPSVYEYVWPQGLAAGNSAGGLQGWVTASETTSTQYSRVYESGWIKIPTGDFETPPGGMKLLGYWGVGQTGLLPNQLYSFISPSGGTTTGTGSRIASQFWLDIRAQNHISWSRSQNVSTAPAIVAGRWLHYEILMMLNDIGKSNGTLKVWINGVPTHNYTDVVYRTSSAPAGFYARRWDPVWGGTGSATKTRSDRMWIDHVYISGVR